MQGGRTLEGFLLARSIATAPPMDCPKRIWEILQICPTTAEKGAW